MHAGALYRVIITVRKVVKKLAKTEQQRKTCVAATACVQQVPDYLTRHSHFAPSSSRITSDSKYTSRQKPQKLHNAEERYSHSPLKHLRQYHVRHLQTRHVQT